MVYRPVIRPIALSALLSLLPLGTVWVAAQAQEQVISVYFEPLKGAELTGLNAAIQDALVQPPFRLETKAGPQTIVISAPSRVEVTRKRVSGTSYAFTLEFVRDRSSLGQSQQACSDGALSECTDQIVQDVKSVAASR